MEELRACTRLAGEFFYELVRHTPTDLMSNDGDKNEGGQELDGDSSRALKAHTEPNLDELDETPGRPGVPLGSRQLQETEDSLADPLGWAKLQRMHYRLADPLGLGKLQRMHYRLADPLGLGRLQRMHDRLADPLGLKEANRLYAGLLAPLVLTKFDEKYGKLFDPLGTSGLGRESFTPFQNLLDANSLAKIQTQQDALRGLISWPSEENISAVGRSLGLVGKWTDLIGAALRFADLDVGATRAALATSGLSRFAAQAQFVLPSTERLLEATLEFIDSPVESSPADLVADVPAELFRAVDTDETLRGTDESLVRDERLELASLASDELAMLLGNDHPELINLLNGARQAATSDNPDRLRHVCISLRELLGCALRKLAPDEAVSAWSTSKEHFHEGRPTRSARLEYIFRSVAEGPLRNLLRADLRSAKELFDVLSSGTHQPTFAANTPTLIVLICRAEGTLLLLLRLASRQD